MASPSLNGAPKRQSVEFHPLSPLVVRTNSALSRRSSANYSPSHSRFGSSHGTLEAELGAQGDSLADELGGWNNDDDEEDDDVEYDEAQDDEDNDIKNRERDSGIDVASSPTQHGHKSTTLELPSAKLLGHRRKCSDYDGSEYGSESDYEESQLVSASLEARLSEIEALARRGTGDISGLENVLVRGTEQFKNLGVQSEIETGVTRLATASSAISTHLIHQTRLLQQLTTAIFSPLSIPLSPEIAETIIPVVSDTLTTLSSLSPSTAPLASIHSLTNQTHDLTTSLSALTDSIHVTRQTSLAASRRLKAAKEAVSEWRKDSNRRDDGVRYVEQGCWEQRLKNRECAGICSDMLNGFEETCNIWRERLLKIA